MTFRASHIRITDDRRAGRHDAIVFDASPELSTPPHAQTLIAEGRLSSKKIAEELGFSDRSSFSQACKRWTGVAPSVARQAGTGA